MNTAIDAAMERIKREMATELRELDVETEGATDLERSEVLARTIALRFGAALLEKSIERRGTGHVGQRCDCARCGGRHEFTGIREKRVMTLVGEITLRRAYYPGGPDCEGNGFPLDEQLGLVGSKTTPGLRRAMAWVGAMEAFGKAEEAFFTVSGLMISKTLIWTTTEKLGSALATSEEEGRQSAMSEPIRKPGGESPARIYGTMDGAKIHLQDGWKEIKVMAWYLPDTGRKDEREHAREVSYAARLENAEAFGEFFWAEGRRRGAEWAKEIVILGDGAPWIWNLVSLHFPRAVQIVDYHHAREHLWEVGKAIFGEGTPATAIWVERVKKHLKAGKIEQVIEAFRNLRPIKRDARDVVRRNIEYFRTNKERMRYRAYRRKGYHIGSGVVEGACKHLIGQRQKGSGMIWSNTGAQAVASLRSALLSHDRIADVDRALKAA